MNDDVPVETKTVSVLIVRHGIAAEPDAAGNDSTVPDAERPLTGKGRKRIRAIAVGLHELVPALRRVASSPYVRARETAAILSDAYGAVPVIESPALAPGGDYRVLAEWIAEVADGDASALVGHAPDLDLLCSWLLSGSDAAFMRLKKGGACLISLEFRAGQQRPRGVLHWLMTARQLRLIGD